MTRPIPTIERDLARAQKASTKASEARAALPPGSSRARVTTANARWMRAAEERDRLERELAAARGALTCRGCDARLSADDGPYCLPCLLPDVFPEGPDWDDLEDGEAV